MARVKTPIDKLGSASVKPAFRPGRIDVEVRGIREPVERDQVLDRLDEGEDPDELVLLDDDVDLGLAGGARLEGQVVERDPDELLRADEVELEVADLREHLDAHLSLAARPPVDREQQAVLLDVEDRRLRWGRPRRQLGAPLEVEPRLDGRRIEPVQEPVDVLDQVGGGEHVLQHLGERRDLALDERRQLRPDLLEVAERVAQRVQVGGDGRLDHRLLLVVQRFEQGDEVVDRLHDLGLRRLCLGERRLRLVLQLRRLGRSAIDQLVRLGDRVLRRLLRLLQIGEEPLHPVEGLRDDARDLQRLAGDVLDEVDQVDDSEELRQRALQELLRVEVLRRHPGEVADRARAAGQPADRQVGREEPARLVAAGRGAGPERQLRQRADLVGRVLDLRRVERDRSPHLAGVVRIGEPARFVEGVVDDRYRPGRRQLLHGRDGHLRLAHVGPRVAECGLAAQ